MQQNLQRLLFTAEEDSFSERRARIAAMQRVLRLLAKSALELLQPCAAVSVDGRPEMFRRRK